MLAGLAEPIPAIPARWLYDRRGSELFDAITRLPSYYPTRTETALLDAGHAGDRGAGRRQLRGRRIGLGLVDQDAAAAARRAARKPMCRSTSPATILRESAARVDQEFPGIHVFPVEADFTKPFALPDAVADLPKLGFFPGSTIGNFVPRSATDLLRHFRDILGTGARLLIGMDRVKPVERLIAAYDEPRRALPPSSTSTCSTASTASSAPTSRSTPSATKRGGTTYCRGSRCIWWRRATSPSPSMAGASRFARGASIHTENSHKYGPRGGRVLLLAGGWTPLAEWSDEAGDFALILAEAQRNRFAP